MKALCYDLDGELAHVTEVAYPPPKRLPVPRPTEVNHPLRGVLVDWDERDYSEWVLEDFDIQRDVAIYRMPA